MAASMTGIGSAEIRRGDVSIFVEVKSVNNRFLEVSCRMSPTLSAYEKDIRDVVREYAHRGKVFVAVTVQGETEGTLGLKVDGQNVVAIRSLLNSLRKKSGVREQLKLDHFLKFSEIFESRGGSDELEKLWIGIRKALKAALENLKTMRQEEGRVLSKDITHRLRELKRNVEEIEGLSQASVPESHKRLCDRVKQLIHDLPLDENRLYTELALLADKLDVTEECVRLRSHLGLFSQTLEREAEVGKKLTFLLQEMNREVNTISAKSNQVQISHWVVQMKEEIEKLREQVQNLE
ncbi:MAG TPA: YicC/YloC family endoribonuclease [bacterium]